MNTSIIFERLKNARKELGLNQAQVAEICGVSRETWSRYESGKLSPGMEVLAAMATAGADVNYILTGNRTEKTQRERLNEKMVQLFEALNETQQKEILSAVSEKQRLNQCLNELEEFKRKRS
ncbi:MAG: helix-turn-helix domain-containing protein [Methylococcales bacterium]|nr:helix-turn-helix domain-containing protein [Methylococcales bacterium]